MTSSQLRQRVKMLDQRLAALEDLRNAGNKHVEGALASLQSELAVWQMLLVSRRLQLHEKVIDLARWRNGLGKGVLSVAAHNARPKGAIRLRR